MVMATCDGVVYGDDCDDDDDDDDDGEDDELDCPAMSFVFV